LYSFLFCYFLFFFFQAEDGIRDATVTGVQTCALPIYPQFDDSFHLQFVLADWAVVLSAGLFGEDDSSRGLRRKVRTASGNLRLRSEERRVGKECRYGWAAWYYKTNDIGE